MRSHVRPLFALGLALLASVTGKTADLYILGGDKDAPSFVNYVVGAELLWSRGFLGQGVVIANVEAGHPWSGHEVFDRSALGITATPALLINAPVTEDSPELGEVDFHATMVAHILVGGKTVDSPNNFTLAGAGMAPHATLWSGAIATTFDKTVENAGSFEISEESFLTPYAAFFTGSNPATGGARADIINSSWGFDDVTAQAAETRILTGLAAQNPSVAAVFSAGNSGYGLDKVGGPATSPNVIAVGSLGGADWLTPSSFSSGGPVSFYHPGTSTLIPAARAAVHIAAPGENFALAAYLQRTGGLEPLLIQEGIDDPATDLYFTFNQSGTSFSAPVVSGGLALLKQLARVEFADPTAALDTRVLRSLVMATALRTEGWDNGQAAGPDGALITTQALDYRTGAGAFDVTRAALVYVQGTADVPGLAGGTDLAPSGWDHGAATFGVNNDYFIDLSGIVSPVELTVSLNWFVNDHVDAVTGEVTYGSFADLDLEVWSVSFGDNPATLLAASRSLYNNSEFLRFAITPGARYGLRVRFDGFVYDLDSSGSIPVVYGLAWATSVVPEPASTAALFGFATLVLTLFRRRSLRQVRARSPA